MTSLLLITGCSSSLLEGERGMSSTGFNEISKDEIEKNLRNVDYSTINALIHENFSLVDTISEGANERVYIFATKQFTINELSSLFESNTKPDQMSELKANKQVFVYKNDILTLQVDQKDSDIVLLELATADFVRNHYSSDFFDGYLALYILDEVLDVDDWGKKRKQFCSSGNCYGGYINTQKYRSGDVGSLRGSSNRGGGPSAGK
jgi:hypothetical protein